MEVAGIEPESAHPPYLHKPETRRMRASIDSFQSDKNGAHLSPWSHFGPMILAMRRRFFWLAALPLAVTVACGNSHEASSSDVSKITPINSDCQTSAQLCQADADLIRSACNGGTIQIGLLLNDAKDDATKTLYEQELSALCPEQQVH